MVAIDVRREDPDQRVAPPSRWREVGLAGIAIGAAILAAALGTAVSTGPGIVRQNAIGTVATVVLIMTLTVVGLILRRSRPDHPMGWLFLGFAASVGLAADFWGASYVGGLPGGDRLLGRTAAWLGAVATLPLWTYLVTSIIVRFPNGHPESERERRLLRYAGVACLGAAVVAGLRPGPFIAFPAYDNPVDLPDGFGQLVTLVAPIAVVVALAPSVLAIVFMVGRYRSASLTGRLQLRWFGFAAALTFAVGWIYVASDLLLANRNPLREVGYAALVLAACSLPIAVLQAILRHRLYDIDTIIGRTVAYGALTAILAGLYSASVRGFNAIFVALTGQENEAALVLTTLVLATTFTPIKSYLEKIAAKRFPATPAPVTATAEPDQLVTAPHDDLDARIEAIARRVAAEVLEERATQGTGP
jgi:hypothetical protein